MDKRKKRWVWSLAVLVLAVVFVLALRYRSGGLVAETALSSEDLARIDRIVLEYGNGSLLRFHKDERGLWSLRFRLISGGAGAAVPAGAPGSVPDSVPVRGTFPAFPGEGGSGEMQADATRIEEFLYVFNLWEISRLPSEEEAEEWMSLLDREGGSLKLKSGWKTLLKFRFAFHKGLFLIETGGQCYAMQSAWQSSTWMEFFKGGPEPWRNRVLMDFPYDRIRSVEVRYAGFPEGSPQDSLSYKLSRVDVPVEAAGKNSPVEVSRDFASEETAMASHRYSLLTAQGCVPLPDKLAERYLSAFRQVFFDPLGKARPGKLLYTLTLVPVKGGEIRLEVFEKLASSGNPAASAMLGAAASASPDSLALEPPAADIFKAVVMFRRDGNRADTVQMPYVVLDKMVKRASWFGQDW